MLRTVIDQLLQDLQPSSGDDLAGFEIDLDLCLSKLLAFESFSIRRSGKPDCMLEVAAVLSNTISNMPALYTVLNDLWNYCAYLPFQASSCHTYQQATIFEFVTASDTHSLLVTGRIEISGTQYQQIVQLWNKAIEPLPPLPPLPDSYGPLLTPNE